jgi:8-oxo-dGTP diphosphatase
MARADQRLLPGRYQVVPRTLCFVTHGDDILLMRGAPDKPLWPNQYNGVGGHVEEGEDVRSAAAREIREETGLEVEELRLRAIINVPSAAEHIGVMLFVFTARSSVRELRASGEGKPEWVSRARLGNLALLEDVPILLRATLDQDESTPPLFGTYRYNSEGRLHVTFSR